MIKKFLLFIENFNLCFVAIILYCSCSEEEIPNMSQVQQCVIAHRGSCSLNNLPENSRASFREALSLNIYGTEFDVQQTKDGILVINHDAYFFESVISQSLYQDLITNKLSNGETLPTLIELFSIYKDIQSEVKLIIDLKECEVEKVVELVDKYSIGDKVKYISFNKNYCDQLVKLGLGKKVLYLNSKLSPKDVKELGYGNICYHDSDYNLHPEWLKEAKEYGLVPCALWPINDISEMNRYISNGIQFFTDIPTVFGN